MQSAFSPALSHPLSRVFNAQGLTLTQRIRALFASAEPGLWYDPSDFSTLFQDSAGTTPVTAGGQPVGKILDKSGRGNHATQPTAINRPVLQQDAFGKYYLAFNGTNSWMSTGSIDFTATDKMTVFAGVRKLSDATRSFILHHEQSGTKRIALEGPGVSLNSFVATSGGSVNAVASWVGPVAPSTAVLTLKSSIVGDSLVLRGNGAQVATSATDQGTGNYSISPLYIGGLAGTSLFFNGNLYSLIVRGALSSDAQIASAETYVNSKTGAW